MHEITSRAPEKVDLNNVRQIKGFDAIQADYPDYLTDESKLTMGAFDFLFFPEDELELAAVVRAMAAQATPMTIAGARTGVVGGCVPKGGALISLERLNQALDLYYLKSADEWRVKAQTGVLLSQLAAMVTSKSFPDLDALAEPDVGQRIQQFKDDPVRYFYPPDPTEMSASLGGTVATNASGARTYRYGPTRDWVRGIRVLTIKGEFLDIPRGKYFSSPSGGFTIYDSEGGHFPIRIPDYSMPRTKCTSGFYAAPHMDLVDLFIGSEGAFGIITAVDVALLAWEPKCSIVQFVDSDDRALALVQALRADKRLQLDFMEFYSENAIKLLRQMQEQDATRVGMPPIPETAGAAIFFELSFDPDSTCPDYCFLEETVAAAGACLESSWAGYETRELDRFKRFRHLLPEKVTQVISERKKNCPEIHRLSSDLAVPDEHLLGIWDLYRTRLNQAGIEWVGFGHVGNNHFHISSMPRNLQELTTGMDIYREFAQAAVACGGSISAEHGVGKIKAKFLKIMYSEDQISQMKCLKQAFDPKMLLNPGNIFVS